MPEHHTTAPRHHQLTLPEPKGEYGGLAYTSSAPVVDWLRFTLPDTPYHWHWTRTTLGPQVRRKNGWRAWYDATADILDGGKIAWCESPSMAERQGILIDLNGASLAALGSGWAAIGTYAVRNGHVTRFDVALDTLSSLVTQSRVVGAMRSGSIATRYRSWVEIEQHRPRSTWTVYLGRTKHATSTVRIYDARGLTRVELQSMAPNAGAMLLATLKDPANVAPQILRRVRFLEERYMGSTDTNKRRRPTAAWWIQALGCDKPGPALTPTPAPGVPMSTTIANLLAYIERQAGPALAAVRLALGNDLEVWLAPIIDVSENRLQPRHYAALAQHKAGGSNGSNNAHRAPHRPLRPL